MSSTQPTIPPALSTSNPIISSPSSPTSITPLYPDIIKDNNTTVEHYFDIQRTVKQIQLLNVKHIALQLCDYLLQYTTSLYSALQSYSIQQSCTCHFYILADTSYSSCC